MPAADTVPDPGRRRLLRGAAAACLAAGCSRDDAGARMVEDVARLEAIPVAGVLRPTGTGQVREAMRRWTGPVSIGGARYSMGGQVAAERSLHLDMRAMRGVVRLDPEARTVRVRAGTRWRDLQDAIDPHDLSVKVMQSYSNFSVGGSVSVNCHGRYVGKGPIAGTVRALELVTADGRVLELSLAHDAVSFGAAIGGYGALGVITEVELDLEPNVRIGRRVERVGLDEYPAWFRERIAGDPDVLLHNADLVPPAFDAPLAISWRRTRAPLTDARRLLPRGLDYGRDQTLIWSASELPGGGRLRERLMTNKLVATPAVVMRNREASLDARALEPRTRAMSTYLLQEYFVPEAAFAAFARTMARIVRDGGANALNISIRHSPPDGVSLMRWAATPVFSFVLYHKQRSWAAADAATGAWTRRLIDAALDHGGRHYLPYRLHATRAQFERAYPMHAEFLRIKRTLDPGNRFRNRLWDRYLD